MYVCARCVCLVVDVFNWACVYLRPNTWDLLVFHFQLFSVYFGSKCGLC